MTQVCTQRSSPKKKSRDTALDRLNMVNKQLGDGLADIFVEGGRQQGLKISCWIEGQQSN